MILRLFGFVDAIPVILAGDRNFDFDFKARRGNGVYAAFVKGGVFQLAEASQWIDTNGSDGDFGDCSLEIKKNVVAMIGLC